MCIPRFVEMIKSDEQEEITEREVLLLGGDSAELAQAAFVGVFSDYEVVLFREDAAAMEEEITSGGAACGFFLESMTEYTYYVDNLTMYDTNTALADEVLREVYRTEAMIAGGVAPEDAMQIMSTVISHEVVTLGKDQIQNYLYTYIMIMALYMVIMLYGQMVATNVATEKSSRAMELLITSVKPTSMMFGKVIASCIAGLVQLVAIFGTALVSFRLNRQYWGDELGAMLDIPPYLLGYMLVFFVLGFFMYAFLYGAVGSTASKVEDINTSVMPITLLFIVGFMVVMFSITSGSVDNLLMKVCSFIPFTAPMAMFARIAMSTVPVYEILISIGILIGTAVGVGVLSAKIYRVGVLLYGTPPKISQILKAIKKA
jgi:ABC-2 type transport system permease protein